MSELELTKKAEAYVATAETSFATKEVLTLQVDRTSRRSLAGSIEALIALLDDLDPDPDLEDGADGEPYLAGWSGTNDDREQDEADDEHSLGWTEDGSQSGDLGCFGSEGDLEPELAWTEHINQANPVRWSRPLPWQVEDGEPYLGWREKTGFGVVGQQNFDDREHDDEREPNGDETDSNFNEDEPLGCY